MSDHFAEVQWRFAAHQEDATTYTRDHTVTLENGQAIANSSAPAFLGNASMANPETLLLAALASCHMLTFLAVASKRGFHVSYYQDKAVGTLGKNNEGRMAITHCTLNPKIEFIGDILLSPEELQKLHESSHRNCFIANSLSVKVDITS